MYLVIGTRSDITFTVTHLSQFNNCPTNEHYAAAKSVLRYLHGAIEWDHLYPSNTKLQLEAYTDASFDPSTDNNRRSFSGYIVRLCDSAISWGSKQQKSVATQPLKRSIWHFHSLQNS
jgi:hypothetical protein